MENRQIKLIEDYIKEINNLSDYEIVLKNRLILLKRGNINFFDVDVVGNKLFFNFNPTHIIPNFYCTSVEKIVSQLLEKHSKIMGQWPDYIMMGAYEEFKEFFETFCKICKKEGL